MGIPIRQLNLSRIGSLVSGTRRLREIADSVEADIVHCHCLRPDILAAYAGLNCVKVSTVHADIECVYRYSHGTLQGTIMANREYAALRKFDAVAAVSETAAQRAAELGLRPEVIPNGVDLNVYAPPSSREKVRRMRESLAWPADHVVVLHTGALIRRKQPLEVVAAFRQSSLSKNGLLAFAGDGSLLEECKLAAGGSRNINFLGHRSDLAELLGAADVVVSNSTAEGLPMALLEACACGLRVIASDIEPHRYIAALFPEQVSLFALGDNEALMELLNALAARGRGNPIYPPAESLDMISAERASRLYQDLYDRVLSLSL
jgi:glycosyltransferase involved in cell wall biosynthesis